MAYAVVYRSKNVNMETIDYDQGKRHYTPGQIWHLTHRCHKREI
jgi:hypothetical protein